MSKLLPCPFCGGRGILNLSAPLAYIYCEICDAQGTACDTNKGAVEHWNARAALDRIRQEARQEAREEALREAADVAKGCGLIIAPESVSQRVGAKSVQSQVAGQILALITKDADNG